MLDEMIFLRCVFLKCSVIGQRYRPLRETSFSIAMEFGDILKIPTK